MLHHALLSMTFAACLLAACTQDEATACGKGSIYRNGACHPVSSTSPATPPGTVAGAAGAGITDSAGAGGAGSGDNVVDPAFGQPCESVADCAAPTDYCTPPSPIDTQYCTVKGCDESPDACPPGWTCFDVSRFVPGEPFICSRPSP